MVFQTYSKKRLVKVAELLAALSVAYYHAHLRAALSTLFKVGEGNAGR